MQPALTLKLNLHPKGIYDPSVMDQRHFRTKKGKTVVNNATDSIEANISLKT